MEVVQGELNNKISIRWGYLDTYEMGVRGGYLDLVDHAFWQKVQNVGAFAQLGGV